MSEQVIPGEFYIGNEGINCECKNLINREYKNLENIEKNFLIKTYYLNKEIPKNPKIVSTYKNLDHKIISVEFELEDIADFAQRKENIINKIMNYKDE